MTTQAQSNTLGRWFVNTLLLGLGGAAATYGALWLISTMRGSSGRLFDGSALGLSGAVFVGIGFVLLMLLRRRWGCGTSLLLVVIWWISVVGMALYFGRNTANGVSLPIYLAAWLALGALVGAVVRKPKYLAGMAAIGAAGVGAAARRGDQQVVRSSGYGRVPPPVVVLLTMHVRSAITAANLLPANAPLPIRNAAVQIVLDHLVRDWWSNGNTDGLTPTDQQDVGVFVQLAWTLVQNTASLPEAAATFRSVLMALMDDWFESWNADGVDGAPRWQWNSG